jgi:uncharacterized membrane protein (UPF0127 family)
MIAPMNSILVRRWIARVVCFLALALGSCTEAAPAPVSPPSGLPIGTIEIRASEGPAAFRVQIAETPDDRAAGLMHVTRLEPDAGMVFLFDGPTDGGFWMKDTLIPLSIAFWDERNRIVAMLDMDPCRADPCPVYSPGAEYVGALEVNVGALADAGVRAGDLVLLTRD